MHRKWLTFTALMMLALFNVAADSHENEELSLLWKYAAGGKLMSSPAVSAGGRVYLYAEDRHVHALDKRGNLLWKFRLAGRPFGSLSVSQDGSIYACTEDGMFHAINQSGEEIWSFNSGGRPSGDPSVSASGTIYLGLESGRLYALGHTGRLRWSLDFGEALVQAPAVDSGTAIYIFTDRGTIISCTPWGTENWRHKADGSDDMASVSAVIHRHVLYTGRGKFLEAVGADGDLQWREELDDNCTSVMMYKNGICGISESGNAFGYSLDGELLWVNSKQQFRGEPASSEEGLYMLSGENVVLLSFNGELLAESDVEGALSQPVLADRMLIAGSDEWIIYALRASLPDRSLWSQRGGDAAHGGRTGRNRFVFDESIYSSQLDWVYLKTMIDSPSVDDREKAVIEIALRIDEQPPGSGPGYMLPLLYRALGGGRLSAAGYPSVRAEAARLIGLIGNFESLEILVAALEEEDDNTVNAAIIDALGTLGTNYRNLSLQTVYNKIHGRSGRPGDDRVAAAAVRTVGLISNYSGNYGTGLATGILIDIYRGHYSKSIRDSAKAELRRMR